jgi:hypothetical protein
MLASAARIPPPGVEREEAPGPPPTIAAARLAAPESAPPTPDPEPEPASPAEPAPGNSLEGAAAFAARHLARRVSRAALRGELRHERVPRDRLRGGVVFARRFFALTLVGGGLAAFALGGAGRSGVVVVVVVAGEVDGVRR